MLPRTLLVALIFSLFIVPDASAQSSYSITRATVSDDYETITVELSKSVEHGYIQYERQGSGAGYDYSSSQHRADNKRVIVIHTNFEISGTSGKQTITLEPCIEIESDDHTVSCGPSYPLTINIGASTSFSDVASNHPNADAIHFVLQQGIVAGYPDGTFKPDSPINRAEFTKIVTLFKFGQEMINMCATGIRFSDIPLDAWYKQYICRAQDGGLVSGYPDGTFRPAAKINFAEAAKIIVLADVFGNPDNDLGDESDPWYTRYVHYLAERSAVPASIDFYDRALTRGEMAEIIFRLKTY